MARNIYQILFLICVLQGFPVKILMAHLVPIIAKVFNRLIYFFAQLFELHNIENNNITRDYNKVYFFKSGY